ncbi:MAG: hypothetical protein SGPRY_012119 [Prymnesium sp.]
MRLGGEVLSYDCQRGWGHIRPDDLSPSVFVHQSEIQSRRGFRTLAVGQRVLYELQDTPDGRRRAVDVTGEGGGFVDDAEEAEPGGTIESITRTRLTPKMLLPRALLASRARHSAQPHADTPSGLPSKRARASELPLTGSTQPAEGHQRDNSTQRKRCRRRKKEEGAACIDDMQSVVTKTVVIEPAVAPEVEGTGRRRRRKRGTAASS